MLRISILSIFLWILLTGNLVASDAETREYVQAGMKSLEKQEYEPAIEAFKKALELKPNMPEIQNALGVAYLNTPESTNHALSAFE